MACQMVSSFMLYRDQIRNVQFSAQKFEYVLRTKVCFYFLLFRLKICKNKFLNTIYCDLSAHYQQTPLKCMSLCENLLTCIPEVLPTFCLYSPYDIILPYYLSKKHVIIFFVPFCEPLIRTCLLKWFSLFGANFCRTNHFIRH